MSGARLGVGGRGEGGRRYYERASDDSQLPLEDPLTFSPGDPAYRVWFSVRILPAFLMVSAVQGLLCLAIFLGSLALLRHPSFVRPSNDSSAALVEGESFAGLVRGDGHGLPLLFFEPSQFFAVLRLVVSLVEMLALGVALYGVWLQRARLMLPLVAWTGLGILASLVYVLLLTWHSVKHQDYFAFCFVGLSLLLVLLSNVLGVHAASELYHYLVQLERFLVAARRRWPEAAKEAEAAPSSPSRAPSSPQGCLSATVLPVLFKHYRLSRALVRLAAEERERSLCLADARPPDAQDLLPQTSLRAPPQPPLHHYYHNPNAQHSPL